MKAIILAAGRGSRMGKYTDVVHKCQTVLHGKPLLAWQLSALKGAGIDEVAIVRGYLGESFNLNTQYFNNTRWHETNMVRSLLCADHWLSQYECVVSYSDIVYSARAVSKLIASPEPLTISYDPHWLRLWKMRFPNPLDDAESFRVNAGVVTEIGLKATSIDEIQGQYMGLFKISPAAWIEVKTVLASLLPAEIDQLDMTSLLQKIVEKSSPTSEAGFGTSESESLLRLNAVPIDDCWYEVDSPSDLACYANLSAVS